jgi:hypothetical protein
MRSLKHRACFRAKRFILAHLDLSHLTPQMSRFETRAHDRLYYLDEASDE